MIQIKPLVLGFYHDAKTKGILRTIAEYVSVFTRSRASVGEDFDAKYGSDTAGNSFRWEIRTNSNNAYLAEGYQPIDEIVLETALASLKIDYSQNVFIDLGCGKGKALLIASRFGFKALVGIEFAECLAFISSINVRCMNIKGCTILPIDATDYKFPSKASVVLLYNPFKPPILRIVLSNLMGSGCSPCYILYAFPKHAHVFAEYPSLFLLYTTSTYPPVAVWKMD